MAADLVLEEEEVGGGGLLAYGTFHQGDSPAACCNCR
eukprot:COSAG01_NODE_10970_length_2037_cov_2.909185_2_plen_37_part_00